ncbi:MAG: hypothetical protein JXQ90_09540 [Cyclobacteriaceae bacterium]
MSKGLFSILLLIALFSMLFGVKWYIRTFESKVLTDEVVRPDLLLENSKLYAREHSYERSLIQLEHAIEAMREIEKEFDESSAGILEESIDDLLVVYNELLEDTLVMNDMNQAYSNALNALTLAELRVTEELIAHDQSKDARVALKYGMYHLKNALRFTSGHKKEYEYHIYKEIDSLLVEDGFDQEEIIGRLEFMIAELDSLVHDEIK